MAYVGPLVPSVEVVNNASLMVIFPLSFIANTFVPAGNLLTPLRVFAEWNPVSAVTQAARALFGNIPPGTARAQGVAAAERGALHAHLGCDDHRHLRSARGPPVPASTSQGLRDWGADPTDYHLAG